MPIRYACLKIKCKRPIRLSDRRGGHRKAINASKSAITYAPRRTASANPFAWPFARRHPNAALRLRGRDAAHLCRRHGGHEGRGTAFLQTRSSPSGMVVTRRRCRHARRRPSTSMFRPPRSRRFIPAARQPCSGSTIAARPSRRWARRFRASSPAATTSAASSASAAAAARRSSRPACGACRSACRSSWSRRSPPAMSAPFVGVSDIVMMPSVTDLAGLNRISRLVLQNAAHAIVGMVRYPRIEAQRQAGRSA